MRRWGGWVALVLALAGLLAVAPQAAAQADSVPDQVVPLDSLVVTASRRLQPLKDAVVTTELVTRRQIEETGASDLSDVLVELTGLQLETAPSGGEGVMLQGLGAERVLVLLDGQPFIGRLSGLIDLSRIPTSMIQRVEVVKGPQSTLYGTDAMGGVINVITREPERGLWSASATATAGTQGRLDLAGNLLGGVGPLSYLADIGHRSIELAPGRAGESGALARRWDGLLKGRWNVAPSFDVEASALVIDERQRWRSGSLYEFADNRQWGVRLGASWTTGRHHFAPTLYASEYDHLNRRATSPQPVPGTGERDVQRLWEAELLYGLTMGPHALDAGIELRREAIASDRVSGHDRTLHSVEPFVQTTWAFGKWSFVPGLRLTWSEQWGTHWTPRVALLFRPVPSVALRASVGQGYRAPAFKELYMEFLNLNAGGGYVVRGNPDLRPETSDNVTLGVEWSGAQLYLRGQVFYNRLRDFIEARLAGDSSGLTVYTYGNIEDGRTWGAEAEVGAAWGRLRADAGYSYLKAERLPTGEELLGRPTHSARLSLGYTLPLGVRTSLVGVYTGRTPLERTAEGTIDREGFLRFDLRLARSLPHGLELRLGTDNLLDARPSGWPGYAGRHLYVGLDWRGFRERR